MILFLWMNLMPSPELRPLPYQLAVSHFPGVNSFHSNAQ